MGQPEKKTHSYCEMTTFDRSLESSVSVFINCMSCYLHPQSKNGTLTESAEFQGWGGASKKDKKNLFETNARDRRVLPVGRTRDASGELLVFSFFLPTPVFAYNPHIILGCTYLRISLPLSLCMRYL